MQLVIQYFLWRSKRDIEADILLALYISDLKFGYIWLRDVLQIHLSNAYMKSDNFLEC